MATYELKFVRGEEVAEGTMAFHFEKPSGFEFKAGQNADYTLVNPPETDAEGNIRTFSYANAPYEDNIIIATRMRDTAFKRVLKGLQAGSTMMKMDGPMGSMTLHNDTSRPAVFLAGGIGITPFRSMVLEAAHAKLPHKIVLMYSNRRPEDAPWLNEMAALEKENPHYKFVGTMTDMSKSAQKWDGETGYIDGAMLKKYVGDDLLKPVYYLAGPPTMVAAMRKMLNENGVNDDYIKAEDFAGY